jgi:TolA-binding protein
LKSTKVTVPVAFLIALLVIGFKADDVTIGMLSEAFVTKAEAQANSAQISSKIGALERQISEVERRVNDVQDKVDMQRIAQIEQEVFGLRTQQCAAIGTPLGNAQLTRILTLVNEWRELTGAQGDPPTFVDCRNLRAQ